MGFRNFGAIAALVAGCSGGDPGEVNIVPRTHSGTPPGLTAASGDASVGDADHTNDGGSVAPDGGGGGADSTVGPTNAFTGAAAYASLPNGDLAANHHTVAGQGFTNPAGKDCFTCHKSGGAGPQFVLGGTVFSSAAGTTGASDVEVRILSATGVQEASVHSDTDGNFWLSAAVAVSAGSKVGVRNATTTLMNGTIGDGSCASTLCHGGPQGPVHIP